MLENIIDALCVEGQEHIYVNLVYVEYVLEI